MHVVQQIRVIFVRSAVAAFRVWCCDFLLLKHSEKHTIKVVLIIVISVSNIEDWYVQIWFF